MDERIATPSQTRRLLEKHGLRPQKRFGQNFLTEPAYIEKIAAAAELGPEDTVLEIGPGLGALTQELAARAGRVLALEIDKGLAAVLQELFAGQENVEIVCADALTADIPAILGEGPFKVTANLPYYITTPIMMRLLESGWDWQSMVLMVQKEVADRLLASPGGKDYGVLTASVAYRSEASLVSHVPASVFYPRPNVDSALVRLQRREKPPVQPADEKLFFQVLRGSFCARRKTLLNSLKQSGVYAGDWREVLAAAGIDGGRRGETLSLAEVAAISDALLAFRSQDRD